MEKMTTLMTFPCDFQIKVIGKNTPAFLQEVTFVTRKYFPETQDSSIKSQLSHEGKYIAISVNLQVLDQPTLDSMYRELIKLSDVQMVL